jgi:hypothetical protein
MFGRDRGRFGSVRNQAHLSLLLPGR